jgi:hypothetical protein
MPWITTKSGAHVNTDWFDRERQIEQNRQQANERNAVRGSTVVKKNGLKSSRDLIPKNSYTNNPEIQEAKKWLSDTWDERQSAGSRWVEAYKELEKAEMKYLDPELVQALGKREAMMFVNDEDHPDTAELRQKVDKLHEREKELQKEAEIRQDVLRRYDEQNSKKQREEYGRPEFKEASGEYPGFKTRESTTSYIDDKLKNGQAKVVEMSPEQYIHECAHYIFTNSTMERTLRSRVGDKDTEKYARMMQSGVKFDTPYINYNSDAQEGLHRAVAAYMNGITKMPVIIVGKRRR